MPGPAAQDRKHGRTPNSLSKGEWREYDDVPYTDAPPMPKPPAGRRKSWHEMAVELWETASVMPQCKDWRPEDWSALKVLMFEVHRYYCTPDGKKTMAQLTEIRRQKIALGIGEVGRKEMKILYRQRVEPGLEGAGPAGAREVVQHGAPATAGKVVSMKDRRSAILNRPQPGADTAAG